MKKSKKSTPKLPKYGKGGEILKNTGLGIADATLGAFGLSNAINDDMYNGAGANFGKGYANVVGGIGKQLLPMAANSLVPGSGQFVSMGQNAIEGNVNSRLANSQVQPEYQNYPLYQPQGQALPFPMGGFSVPNAEVEKEENAITPDGQFVQYNGPSHEGGGIPTNLPPESRIFSDRLKYKKGITFAKQNKKYDTSKEDEILSDSKSSATAKKTAELNKALKLTKSNDLFELQESLKQERLGKYASSLGMKYPGGGVVKYAPGGILPSQNPYDYQSPDNPYDLVTNPNSPYGVGSLVKNPMFFQPTNNQVPTTNQVYQKPTFNPLYPQSEDRATSLNNYNTNYNNPNNIESLDRTTPLLTNGMSPNNQLDAIQAQANTPLTKDEITDIANNKYGLNPNTTPTPNNRSQAFLEYAKKYAPHLIQAGFENLGNAYVLGEKGPQKVKYERAAYNLLDPTASLRDAEIQNRMSTNDLANVSGGNAGNYLSNRISAQTANTLNRDRVNTQYENLNKDIMNKFSELNNRTANNEIDMQAMNDAQYRNNRRAAVNSIGYNLAGTTSNIGKDMHQYSLEEIQAMSDKERLELLSQQFNSPKTASTLSNYKKNTYNKNRYRNSK